MDLSFSGMSHGWSIRFGSTEFWGHVDTLSSLPPSSSSSWAFFVALKLALSLLITVGPTVIMVLMLWLIGVCFSAARLFYFCECNISEASWRKFLKIDTNLHLDLRTNWSVFGDQNLKYLRNEGILMNVIPQKRFKGISGDLTQTYRHRHILTFDIYSLDHWPQNVVNGQGHFELLNKFVVTTSCTVWPRSVTTYIICSLDGHGRKL